MRGKKAKLLRRAAEALTKGARGTDYGLLKHTLRKRVDKQGKFMQVTGTVILDPKSTRFRYRRLKRIYRRGVVQAPRRLEAGGRKTGRPTEKREQPNG